jgi:hypothetical protein
MILISHRGNVDGKLENYENKPNYINLAIQKGFDVEVDVWYIDGKLYLGHDNPEYETPLSWFIERKNKLWVHCKDDKAIVYFNSLQNQYDFNYFWHEKDTLTLTSHNYIWVYPGKQPIKHSIAVMPEQHKDDISQAIGVCSDYIENYKI